MVPPEDRDAAPQRCEQRLAGLKALRHIAILAIIAPREYRRFCGIRLAIDAAAH
jgi:hypothetical protein